MYLIDLIQHHFDLFVAFDTSRISQVALFILTRLVVVVEKKRRVVRVQFRGASGTQLDHTLIVVSQGELLANVRQWQTWSCVFAQLQCRVEFLLLFFGVEAALGEEENFGCLKIVREKTQFEIQFSVLGIFGEITL